MKGSAVAGMMSAMERTPAAQRLWAGLERGGVCRVHGVSEAAQGLVTAWVSRVRGREDRVVVWVVEGVKALESVRQDLGTWLGEDMREGEPGSGEVRVRVRCFPEWEILPQESKLPPVDVVAERLETLEALGKGLGTGKGGGLLVVTTAAAVMQRTLGVSALRERTREVRVGLTWDPLDLVEWLEEQGYEPEAQVTQKGVLSLRGGIVDVWPPAAAWPVRLEFFGNEVESLRTFDPETQLSRGGVEHVTLTPAGELGMMRRWVESGEEGRLGSLMEHVPSGAVWVWSEPEKLEERARMYGESVGEGDRFHGGWAEGREMIRSRGDRWLELRSSGGEGASGEEEVGWAWRLPDLEVFRPLGVRAPEPAVAEVQRREFLQQMHRWSRGGLGVHVFCNNAGERDRFGEIWAEQGWGGVREWVGEVEAAEVGGGGIWVHVGALGRGFLAEDSGFVVVTDAEIFGRYKVLRPRRVHGAQAARTRSLLDVDFSEFESGDYVVHLEHGIGRYQGLEISPVTPGHRGGVGRAGQECLVIEYAAGRPGDAAPRLYVPVSEAHLVSKYVGAGKARPPLNVLGGARWAKARKDAERAVADLAADLLEIQAARETEAGYAFGLDTGWQREFEASFVYEETPDQERAIEATKRDMERARPMDRLICGDVGFGKTEVAIRAAFKSVMGGRQVAVLVPTTVLAQQHYQTFRERMSDYPVQVELLSRYRSKREQRQVLERLASGSVDIVIGTHRLVQKDVVFKELGLVVIDEEQRFGVAHKERFKRLRRTVDVLTLSATPIPRTLYMALSGARDMSTIETPPQDRLPIETVVSAYDERLIRDAIRREMGRQGQVFFLHNRVGTIEAMALKVRALVPEARVVMGHGQMDPDELEEVMTRFVSGEADVLVSTTIVESGLDIPNANTIIIDRADRFGLAELYQLRGRVGRYKHQAYAYLMLPRHAQLLTEARKRIAAIRQYSSLGSGFKIAMRDLEIRGAGNLLGPQQSGHITAVGFDLYCQLLKQSIASLKGEPVVPRVEVEVRLDFLALNAVEEGGRGAGDGRVVAGLPESYVPESAQRVDLHRRLAQVSGLGELRKLEAELKDRFGPPPPAVQRLLQVSELRLFAWALGVTAIEVREDQLRLTRGGDYVQVGGRFPRLTKRDAKGRLNEIRRFLGMLTPPAAAGGRDEGGKKKGSG